MPRSSPQPPSQSGFTLLEMGIVLTIIGLIVGGIIVARDLIRVAEVQSVVSDQDRYRKAIQLFEEKYHCLPGDMPTAETFWGSDAGCPNTPTNTIPKTATCNGNGNGRIDDEWESSGWFAPHDYEAFRMWQQLADAGFIQGAYTGVTGSASNADTLPGLNVPASQISGAGFFVAYGGIYPSGDGAIFPGSYGHLMIFGARRTFAGGGFPTMGGSLFAPVLTVAEAQLLDNKIDDGMPGTGSVRAMVPSTLPNCATSNLPTAAYTTGINGIQCALVFITGF